MRKWTKFCILILNRAQLCREVTDWTKRRSYFEFWLEATTLPISSTGSTNILISSAFASLSLGLIKIQGSHEPAKNRIMLTHIDFKMGEIAVSYPFSILNYIQKRLCVVCNVAFLDISNHICVASYQNSITCQENLG